LTSTTALSLVEQRQSLCRQLQAQRQVIALQLGPESDKRDSYPRSRIMRFVTQRPAAIIRLLAGVATLLMT
jgi:type VI protein secretion system component VasF